MNDAACDTCGGAGDDHDLTCPEDGQVSGGRGQGSEDAGPGADQVMLCGSRATEGSPEDPVRSPADELLVTKQAAMFLIPLALLEDLGGMGEMPGLLGRALRGEIELEPPPPPPWHRCVACWLVSLLPGHDRCEHGRLGCDDCY